MWCQRSSLPKNSSRTSCTSGKTSADLKVVARGMHMTPAALDIALRRIGRGDLLRKNQPIAS